MSERVLQAAVVVAFGVVVVLAIRLLDQDNPVKETKASSDSVKVAEAIAVGQEKELAVTGYLFEGAGWPMRLCNGRRDGDPPRCVGPFLYVERMDPNAFNMDEGQAEEGPLRWVDDPVTLLGRLKGTELNVSQVLSTSR